MVKPLSSKLKKGEKMENKQETWKIPKEVQTKQKSLKNHDGKNTEHIKLFINGLRIDLVGIADLQGLKTIPMGLLSKDFVKKYHYAIVMGVQLGKLGHETPGIEASIYLEKVALQVMGYLEDKKQHSLIIHTEDEFDPINRIGLISLKVLAKAAGLGWQGRSLLIISPDYGPIHRLIAILTDTHLQPEKPIANKCGNCSICIHECPTNALKLVRFEDHPKNREHVLNLHACLGDKGCKVCLITCPWQEKTYRNDNHQERSLG